MDKGISGILVINKPEGKTSFYVDLVCKKLLNAKKVGHLGTLDPFATGVLAIAINDSTKAIPYIRQKKKVYEFEIKFGERTDTGDKTGKVVEISDNIPTRSEIESVIPEFVGEIFQKPHIFSAIKINGKRAYDLARMGETPSISPRKITIFDLELREHKGIGDEYDETSGNSQKELMNDINPIFRFKTTVSPGTYIRTLSEDIAKSLGTVGYTFSLKRIQDCNFFIENAISLDVLKKTHDNITDVLVPLENILDDIPVVFISCQDEKDLLFGKRVAVSFPEKVEFCLASAKSGFLGIVEPIDGMFHLKRLLRLGFKGE
ncbi:MAG: tRNA pseudouridine(55) synthase TruB [Holosporales bacterium]|jgi:tRNA pseudouridine55 synthase|nr:tRNA pseudouridine(55) synthase TruB [Holosporales bacterium]